MTIGEAAGPVLLRVLPQTLTVIAVVLVVLALPVVLPRLLCWLRGAEHADCAHARAAADRAHVVHHAPRAPWHPGNASPGAHPPARHGEHEPAHHA